MDQLLLQIAAVLMVGRVLARGLRRHGQPMVIAEILAGIARGPSLLGLLAPERMASLFPKSSMDLLGTVAQLGLVFFLFLVGLEFDPRQLEGRARAAVAISGAGIVAPLALGIGVETVLPADLTLPGVPLHSFALFVGVAMSVTAFPVLARILTERQLVRTPVGAMALAAAAVDDVAAWCLLAPERVLVRVQVGQLDDLWTLAALRLAEGSAATDLLRPACGGRLHPGLHGRRRGDRLCQRGWPPAPGAGGLRGAAAADAAG